MDFMFDVCMRGDEFYVLREDKVVFGDDVVVKRCGTFQDAEVIADLYQAHAKTISAAHTYIQQRFEVIDRISLKSVKESNLNQLDGAVRAFAAMGLITEEAKWKYWDKIAKICRDSDIGFFRCF